MATLTIAPRTTRADAGLPLLYKPLVSNETMSTSKRGMLVRRAVVVRVHGPVRR